MKNTARHGKSARHGNKAAPYTKYKKKPFDYGEGRLNSGNLRQTANDRLSNKYRI